MVVAKLKNGGNEKSSSKFFSNSYNIKRTLAIKSWKDSQSEVAQRQVAPTPCMG